MGTWTTKFRKPALIAGVLALSLAAANPAFAKDGESKRGGAVFVGGAATLSAHAPVESPQNKKPSISLKANPPVGFTPLRVVVTAELKPDDWPSNEPIPVEAAIREENYARVRTHVDRLPEQMRAAVLLHFQENLTGREIAYALGISYDAARLKISRGVAKLRQWMGNDA